MDWENERYVRLYVRDTADILAIGWEGRALFAEILRKVDRCGLFDSDEPEVIAELIRMPVDVVTRALRKLSKRKMVVKVGDGLLIPNFLEAQEAKSSDAQRSRELRARRRDQAKAGGVLDDADVTDCDNQRDGSVTNRDGSETICDQQPGVVVENVTPSRTVPSRTEPSLAENSTLSVASGPDPLPVLGDESRTKPTPPTSSAKKPTKPKPPPTDVATKAAKYLQGRILETAPNCAAARMTPKQIEAWARTLDKLEGLSPEHTWRAIKETVDWLHDTENTFVVQSAKSLAEKWDRIQANRRKAPISRNGAPKPEDPYERAARIREQQGAQ